MKILLILPYIGRLPEYYPAFAHSLEYFDNKNVVDFFIITNDKEILKYKFPDFVKVRCEEEDTIKNLFYKKCGVVVYSGYKLCDYKPLYGSVFSEECKGYDFWGYCDVDTMLGDLVSWLNRVDFAEYDRVGADGHFTIYRNTSKITELWKCKIDGIVDIKYVSNTTFPCYFDEGSMNDICTRSGIRFYKYNHVANVEPFESLHFKSYEHCLAKENLCQLFVWEKGKTYIYQRKNGQIIKKEYAYIHYPYRNGLIIHQKLGEKVLLTHEGFYNFDKERIFEYFDKYGRADNIVEKKTFRKMQYGKWKNNRSKRIFFELKTLGFKKTVLNIKYRLRMLSLKTLFYKIK